MSKIKPIDSEDEELTREEKIALISREKIFFLFFLLSVGLYFGYKMNNRPKQIAAKKIVEKKTEMTDAEKEDLVTVLKDTAKETTKNIAYTGFQKAQDASEKVLGVATEKVEEVASKSAEKVTDYLYDHTVRIFINKLKDSLPGKVRDQLKEDLAK